MSNPLKDKLEALESEAKSAIVAIKSLEDLYESKVIYLGKKGRITEILKDIGTLPVQERPELGKVANQIKGVIGSLIDQRSKEIKDNEILEALKKETVDVTLPGLGEAQGAKHPITLVLDEMKEIFSGLGLDIFEGPEIESEFYNFEALNIPEDHPARDMQDTFYLRDGRLLRTHTSPVQIHVMEDQKPPIAMVAPGAVYRCDADVSHSPMFHQIEGLVVDKGIHFGHLKGVLEVFLKKIFNRDDLKMKLRPSFFPFTEPSAEVDISCVICEGSGCRVCKNTGWLEIMGCGMVDPEVFKSVKIDAQVYQGFAFGIGVERVAMLKYGVSDIRLFFENDLRFLRQF